MQDRKNKFYVTFRFTAFDVSVFRDFNVHH